MLLLYICNSGWESITWNEQIICTKSYIKKFLKNRWRFEEVFCFFNPSQRNTLEDVIFLKKIKLIIIWPNISYLKGLLSY